MAKAKKGLAAITKRRNARRKSPAVANPPVGTDFTQFILPGFGAYAATRLLSRMVFSIVQRRWPKLGKHAGALAAAAAFGGSWFAAHRIKKLAPYHDAVVVGSGIAAMQTVVRTYLPKYGWIVSDYKPSDLAPAQLPPSKQIAAAADELEGDEYSYLEAELEAADEASPAAAADSGGDDNEITEEDLASVLGDDESADDLYTGSFAN